jgi:hypothetical protein
MKNPADLSSKYKHIYCDNSYGPYFGIGGTIFYVPAEANTDKKSCFLVRDNYKDLPTAANGGCMYVDGDSDFQISEVEVYKVIPN